MKCIEIRQNKLHLSDIEDPKVSRGEVLIRVHAAGVNRADIMQRKGKSELSTKFRNIPGLEVAGEIVEISWGSNKERKGRKRLHKGDRVIAVLEGGGYAEFCSVPAERCMHIPDYMPYEEAASIGYSFLVAWHNLVDIAKLKRDETILIHGGSSGFATAAIQIANKIGAKVIVTTSHDGKCKSCERLGADLAINYKAKSFPEVVKKFTKGNGVDVVIDIVGGEYIEKNIEVLKNKGRHISLSTLSNNEAVIDIDELIEKEISLIGSSTDNLSSDEISVILERLEKKVLPLMKQRGFFRRLFGKKCIKPVISKQFLLSDAQLAHDYMDRGIHFGKVVLRII